MDRKILVDYFESLEVGSKFIYQDNRFFWMDTVKCIKGPKIVGEISGYEFDRVSGHAKLIHPDDIAEGGPEPRIMFPTTSVKEKYEKHKWRRELCNKLKTLFGKNKDRCDTELLVELWESLAWSRHGSPMKGMAPNGNNQKISQITCWLDENYQDEMPPRRIEYLIERVQECSSLR